MKKVWNAPVMQEVSIQNTECTQFGYGAGFGYGSSYGQGHDGGGKGHHNGGYHNGGHHGGSKGDRFDFGWDTDEES